MKRPRKVVHVELREPYLGKCHYYFGSVSAIYDVLPALECVERWRAFWEKVCYKMWIALCQAIKQGNIEIG